MGDDKYNKVRLIPWDPANAQQYQRMYLQRIACGWRQDEIGQWKDKLLRGTKFLYWIVSFQVSAPVLGACHKQLILSRR